MTDANACTIRFVRPSQYADWLRSYELWVNGTSVGKLARNDVLEITLPAGTCTIDASIDWGRSQPLVVRTSPGNRRDRGQEQVGCLGGAVGDQLWQKQLFGSH